MTLSLANLLIGQKASHVIEVRTFIRRNIECLKNNELSQNRFNSSDTSSNDSTELQRSGDDD